MYPEVESGTDRSWDRLEADVCRRMNVVFNRVRECETLSGGRNTKV